MTTGQIDHMKKSFLIINIERLMHEFRGAPFEICQRWGLVCVLDRGSKSCFYLITFIISGSLRSPVLYILKILITLSSNGMEPGIPFSIHHTSSTYDSYAGFHGSAFPWLFLSKIHYTILYREFDFLAFMIKKINIYIL